MYHLYIKFKSFISLRILKIFLLVFFYQIGYPVFINIDVRYFKMTQTLARLTLSSFIHRKGRTCTFYWRGNWWYRQSGVCIQSPVLF